MPPGWPGHLRAGTFQEPLAPAARVLITFTPGNIEGFFDYGLPDGGEVPSEQRLQDRLVEFAPKYGLEVLGP